MKIYTKTGDAGETGLFGGKRVSKADLRVEAYGEVDELNAQLGWVATLIQEESLLKEIGAIQSELFALGADLATVPDSPASGAQRVSIDPASARRLEALIDGWEKGLKPLRNFILPGGCPAAAALQICRSVCRRAERRVVRLAASEEVNPEAVVYLNRLSDFLFVMARWVNHLAGVDEPIWRP
ncbi:MAG TPA: cob(I)yrinic acid a,c-diamide adenosyltransferase [Candidatus Polarisedimenticolia bacterium]|nr:cob(I)yrinic acid a,c-diamide adenosyltransferase [Candidatus Polarisedimenticolia bacterium]